MLIKIGDAWVDPQEIAAFFPTADLPSTPKIGIILHSGGNVWAESTMDEAEAALIDAGYIENPYPENDTPDLTDGEIEVLADLYNRAFEYLARDADGKLYAFRDKPEKDGAYWNSIEGGRAERIDEGFDFVVYEDEKPWSIAYLLTD